MPTWNYTKLHPTPWALHYSFFFFFSGFDVQYGHTSFGVEPLYLFICYTNSYAIKRA
jgi:hypothetical protein